MMFMEGRALPGRRSFSEGGSRPPLESATTNRGPPLICERLANKSTNLCRKNGMRIAGLFPYGAS